MSLKTFATLALATGFAVAKPISRPRDITPAKRNLNGGFSFIDDFNKFDQQKEVFEFSQQNFQLQVNDGFNQQDIIIQAQQALIINQGQNGFNSDLKTLFRKSNFASQFNGQGISTAVIVVTEVRTEIQDVFGNSFEQEVFAQSVIVADRGFPATQTIQVFSQETIIAKDVINGVGGFDKFNQDFGLNNDFNNGVAFPVATAGVQLFGQKPVWDQVFDDPAAVLGGIWERELLDAQNIDFNAADKDLNNQIALEQLKKLEEQKALEEQLNLEQQDEEDVNQDEENVEDVNQEEEQNEEEVNPEEEVNQEEAVQEEDVAQDQAETALQEDVASGEEGGTAVQRK